MGAAAIRRMTADEFLEWSLDQEEKYELVDGEVVPMGDWEEIDGRTVFMAGAKNGHDVIVTNLIAELRNRLRGRPCRPYSGDTAARMVAGNIRRPDVTVDCRPPELEGLESHEPTVFFEVLSRSTRSSDLIRKSDEYRRLPTLRHYVVIEPRTVSAMVWTRDENGFWPEPDVYRDLGDVLPLPAIGVELPLAEIYADVPFPA